MKRYVKFNEEPIMSASKVGDIDTFEKVMRVARKRMICCISANIYDFDAIEDDTIRLAAIKQFDNDVSAYNIAMTKSLNDELTESKYHYFETFGGWVDPKTGVSTEESGFIVLGPEYNIESPLISTEDILEGFREFAIRLCRDYNQWAVLVIDYAEDIDDSVSGYAMDIRKELYRKFSENKNYMSDEYLKDFEQDEDMQSEYKSVNRDLDSEKFTDIDLYSLHGVYYNKHGDMVKEYNNVSSAMIGEFFTALARNQGAEKFTLLASSNFYIPYVYTCQRSWHRPHDLEEIYAQRETRFYKQMAQSILDDM